MFQIMFTDRPAIRDYREFCQFVDRAAFQKFVLSLFPFGVYASPSAALHSIVTLAHTDAGCGADAGGGARRRWRRQ